MGRFRFFSEELGEDAGFVASAAGEIEETEMIFFGEMGVEKITEIGLQGFQIALEEFCKRSVGHAKRVNYDSDFGILKLGFLCGPPESTST